MRECGSCTLCCKLTFVPELSKVEGQKCIHCTHNCSIYPIRPNSCRTYECAWLSGKVDASLKPDIVGFIVEVYPKMVAVILDEGTSVKDVPINHFSEFLEQGKPVIATGQFAKLPKNMTPQQAKDILVETVKEYRHGTS